MTRGHLSALSGHPSGQTDTDKGGLYPLSGVRPASPSDEKTSPLSEADLLRGVLDLCRVLGWRTYHPRPAMTRRGWRTPVQGDGIGWPDLAAVRGDRLVVAELKSERGRTTPEQADWLEALAAAGVEAYTWRPADYPDNIAEILR